MEINVTGLELSLRQYEWPLLSLRALKTAGNVFVSEFIDPEQTVPNLTLTPEGRRLSSFEATSTAANRAYAYALKTKTLPMRVYCDLEGSAHDARASFAPDHLYGMQDVKLALLRVLPKLHVRRGLSEAASHFLNDGQGRQFNLLHELKQLMFGRTRLSISHSRVRLLQSPHNLEQYLTLDTRGLALLFNSADGMLNIEYRDISVIQAPHSENQPCLLKVPRVEIFFSVFWSCIHPALEESAGAAEQQQPLGPHAGGGADNASQAHPGQVCRPNSGPRSRSYSGYLAYRSETSRHTCRAHFCTCVYLLDECVGLVSGQLDKRRVVEDQGHIDPDVPERKGASHAREERRNDQNGLSKESSGCGFTGVSVSLNTGSLLSLLDFGETFASIASLPLPRSRRLARWWSFSKGMSFSRVRSARSGVRTISLRRTAAPHDLLQQLGMPNVEMGDISLERALVENVSLMIWEGLGTTVSPSFLFLHALSLSHASHTPDS